MNELKLGLIYWIIKRNLQQRTRSYKTAFRIHDDHHVYALDGLRHVVTTRCTTTRVLGAWAILSVYNALKLTSECIPLSSIIIHAMSSTQSLPNRSPILSPITPSLYGAVPGSIFSALTANPDVNMVNETLAMMKNSLGNLDVGGHPRALWLGIYAIIAS